MRKRTWLWLLLLTAFTVVPGIVLIVTADPDCIPDIFGTPCEDAGPDRLAQGLGAGLLIAWVIGFFAILFVAGARQGRKPEDSGPCPQCGREVTAGSPTCLNCGYNLATGR